MAGRRRGDLGRDRDDASRRRRRRARSTPRHVAHHRPPELMPNCLHLFCRGGTVAVLGVLALCACSPQKIVEDTPASVSIRYDGVAATLDDATATANQLCAAHGKVAHLRSTDMKAALEHF